MARAFFWLGVSIILPGFYLLYKGHLEPFIGYIMGISVASVALIMVTTMMFRDEE